MANFLYFDVKNNSLSMPFSKRQYRPLKDVKVKTYTLHSTDKGRTKLNIEQSLHNGNQKGIFFKKTEL